MHVIEEIHLSALVAAGAYERTGTLLTGVDNQGKKFRLCAGLEYAEIGDPESGFPCECGSVFCRLEHLRISNLAGSALFTQLNEDEQEVVFSKQKFFCMTHPILILGNTWDKLAAQFPNLRPTRKLAVVRRRDLISAWWSEIEKSGKTWKEMLEGVIVGNTWDMPQVKAALDAVLQWANEKPEAPVDLHRVETLDAEVEQIWSDTSDLCWEGFVLGTQGDFHLYINGLTPLPLLERTILETHEKRSPVGKELPGKPSRCSQVI